MKTFKIKGIVLAIMLSFGLSNIALASDGEIMQDSAITNKTSLVEIGTAPKNLVPLKGFAKNLPLIEVLRQITPSGWKVKKAVDSQKIDIKQEISWQGGNNWVKTLDNISTEYGFTSEVNWNKKEIVISKPVLVKIKNEDAAVIDTTTISPQNNKLNIFKMEGEEDVSTKKVETTQVKVVEAVKPKVEVIALKNWRLDSNKSLATNVEEWAKKAGYQLVWTGEDYAVQDRLLNGEFDSDANGPIKQLSIDYGPKSRVEKPLSFVFYNNTLVVENLKYEQKGARQYTEATDSK